MIDRALLCIASWLLGRTTAGVIVGEGTITITTRSPTIHIDGLSLAQNIDVKLAKS